jgi:hypothetical protein
MGRGKREARQWVGVREYAERRGVSVQAIYKAIRGGRLVRSVRKRGGQSEVDPEVADQEWAARTNPAMQRGDPGDGKPVAAAPVRTRRRKGGPQAKPEEAPATPAPAKPPAPAPLEATPALDLAELERRLTEARGDYGEVRAIREELDARLRVLDYQVRTGELVEAGPAWQEVFKRVRDLRDVLLAIPEQIVPLIGAEPNTHRRVLLLEVALVEALDRFASRA